MPHSTTRSPDNKAMATARMIAMGACIFFLSMAGCKKDEDAKTNAFNFDGHTRGLRSAFLLYASAPDISNDNGTRYYQNVFMLLSAGLITDGYTMTGQGNAIELSVHCATQDLEAGTYILTGPESPANVLEMPEGRVQLDNAAASSSSQGTQVFSFTAAQMTVTRSGREYTIDIAGTIEGKIIKAHFTGMMTTLQKN